MVENKQQALNDNSAQDKPGFEFADSNAFVCNMETGICGTVNQKKETKK